MEQPHHLPSALWVVWNKTRGRKRKKKMKNMIMKFYEVTSIGSCSVSFDDVAKCMSDESIGDAITHLINKQFSHIPILDRKDDHVIGVFSVSTLMRIVSDDVPDRDHAPLETIRQYLNNHKFEVFPFVSASDNVAHVQELLTHFQEQGKHVGLFLVTDNGSEKEPLRGIFTEWDFAKVSANLKYHHNIQVSE